jgi:hypothetical protein
VGRWHLTLVVAIVALLGLTAQAQAQQADIPAGFPNAANTGVPDDTVLTQRSGITVRTAGQVISGVDAPWIDVQAPNVVIRNSRVGRGTQGRPIVSNSTNLLVEDTTIHGLRGSGISWNNYTARRVEVYGTENGFDATSNTTIEDSWVHDLYTAGGAHSDGIQTGSGGGGNIVIRRNSIDPVPGTSGATAPIILHTGSDPQNHDVWIEKNYLDGRGSAVSLYCARRPAQRIYVNDNLMRKGVYGQYTDSCTKPTTVTEFFDNRDAVTGALIPGSTARIVEPPPPPPPTSTAPVADFTITPNPAQRTKPVTFAASGTCADAPCSHQWFHGDAASTDSIGTGASASFTYTGPVGPRTVTVKTTDADGQTDTETKTFQLVEPAAEPPPPPPSGGLPDASNTGVPEGTALTASGPITTSAAGQVIDARDITGTVTVNHANVTIKRSRITSNGFNVIDNNSTGLVVEDSELLDGPDTGQANCHNGIAFGGYTIRRSEITGCENAVDAADGNATIADNYIHDLDTVGPSHVWGNSPHTDGIQVAGDNVNILHNWVDPVAVSGGTAAIIMDVSQSGNRNVVIEDNYLDGRGSSYALYAPRYQMSGNLVNRNRMLRGVGGYAACVKVGITVDQFDGNVDHATGAALLASQMDNTNGCSN